MTTQLQILSQPLNAEIIGSHEYAGCVGTALKASATHVEIAFGDARDGTYKWIGRRIIHRQFIQM